MTGQTKMCLIRPFFFSDAIFHMFRFGILKCCFFRYPFLFMGLESISAENTKIIRSFIKWLLDNKRGLFRLIYFSIDDR